MSTGMEQLLKLLTDINFDQRYYDYVDAHKNSEATLTQAQIKEQIKNALQNSGNAASYNQKEKFFRFEEQAGPYTLANTIALYYESGLELIILVQNDSDKFGGPLHGLARDVALKRDPKFSYSPRYPRIPFGNKEELTEAVDFSLELFNEIKQALLNDRPMNSDIPSGARN